ncbi:MAG: LysR family transcriptional regulator [Sedimentisphaerales bacterium]|nr:LysR family transcriptional regulator [Sedimentisphaerales bacterium]
MKKLQPRFKLWLNAQNIQGAFGDGKWRLLRAIQTEGSLQAASRLLQISYRKAWGDLKKTQSALGVALVAKQRGGKSGGQTVLTDKGKEWLDAYGRFRKQIEQTVQTAWAKHLGRLAR